MSIRNLKRSLFLCLTLLVVGCSGETKSTKSDQPAFAGVSVEVSVVGDENIAAVLQQLQGEWKAQTGADLTVNSISEEEFLSQNEMGSSVAIIPPYLVGIAQQRGWLAPLEESVRNNGQLNWRDIFPNLQTYEASWNRQAMGIPLGAPRFLLAYRADLLRQIGHEQPPQTWTEYYAVASELANSEAGLKIASLEPSSEDWLALVFLAKAAALAKHPDYFSTAFNRDTMDAMINSPPFVETLAQWAAAAPRTVRLDENISPQTAYGMLRSGAAGMAITWPAANWNEMPKQAGAEIAFAPLPGADQAYVPGEAQPQQTDHRHVSVTSFGGYVGVVGSAAEEKQQAASWQLLIQLAADWSQQLAAANSQLLFSRQSQTADAARWLPPQDSAAAGTLSSAALKAFDADDGLTALPIPGRDRYLASLSAGVRRALQEEQSPEEALQQVAEEWNAITQELGVDQQQQFYRASVTHGY